MLAEMHEELAQPLFPSLQVLSNPRISLRSRARRPAPEQDQQGNRLVSLELIKDRAAVLLVEPMR